MSEPGGYELVKIPGGVFLLGTPEQESGRFKYEWLLHEIQAPDFYLGRYPATNEEYGRFLKDNPKIEEPRYWAERKFNQPRQPVVGGKLGRCKTLCRMGRPAPAGRGRPGICLPCRD